MSPFAVGNLAVSKTHLVLVSVLSREGHTMTVADFPCNTPLPGTVTDDDLLTFKEFETWAPSQPWYTPPPPINSLQDALDQVQEILARIGRSAD